MNQILSFVFEYITDILFACIAQIPWVMLKYFAKPYQRGFFCNDQSLMYPYKDSTVSNSLLTAINMTIPILTIFIVELKLSQALQTFFSPKENDANKLLFIKFAFKTLCIFFVGFGITQSVTNILKWTVGRLRPHFFWICIPSYKAPCNAQLYITNAECFGTNIARIKDARLSFPSGHSSSAMYTMLFTVIYIHYRSKRCRLQTFKAFYQGSLLMLAIWIGATRVSDFKHHWSDVLVGLLIGAVFGILFGSCAVYGLGPFWKRFYCNENSINGETREIIGNQNALKSYNSNPDPYYQYYRDPASQNLSAPLNQPHYPLQYENSMSQTQQQFLPPTNNVSQEIQTNLFSISRTNVAQMQQPVGTHQQQRINTSV